MNRCPEVDACFNVGLHDSARAGLEMTEECADQMWSEAGCTTEHDHVHWRRWAAQHRLPLHSLVHDFNLWSTLKSDRHVAACQSAAQTDACADVTGGRNMTEECADQMWAAAGCTTNMNHAGWRGWAAKYNLNMMQLKHDFHLWATLLSDNHVQGCQSDYQRPGQAEARRLEEERLAAERLEAERREAERLAAEQAEAERREAARLAAERAEAERIAAARSEEERLEAEQIAAAQEALARQEAARQEAERIAAEQREAERLEAERLQVERVNRTARVELDFKFKFIPQSGQTFFGGDRSKKLLTQKSPLSFTEIYVTDTGDVYTVNSRRTIYYGEPALVTFQGHVGVEAFEDPSLLINADFTACRDGLYANLSTDRCESPTLLPGSRNVSAGSSVSLRCRANANSAFMHAGRCAFGIDSLTNGFDDHEGAMAISPNVEISIPLSRRTYVNQIRLQSGYKHTTWGNRLETFSFEFYDGEQRVATAGPFPISHVQERLVEVDHVRATRVVLKSAKHGWDLSEIAVYGTDQFVAPPKPSCGRGTYLEPRLNKCVPVISDYLGQTDADATFVNELIFNAMVANRRVCETDGRCETPTNLEQGRTNGTPLEQRLHDRLLVVEQYIRGYQQAFDSEVDKLELYHVQGVASKIDNKRREEIRRYQTPDTANCDGLARLNDIANRAMSLKGLTSASGYGALALDIASESDDRVPTVPARYDVFDPVGAVINVGVNILARLKGCPSIDFD
jgi:hypothetical protein